MVRHYFGSKFRLERRVKVIKFPRLSHPSLSTQKPRDSIASKLQESMQLHASASLRRPQAFAIPPKSVALGNLDVSEDFALACETQTASRFVWREAQTPLFNSRHFRNGAGDFNGTRTTGPKSTAMNLASDSVVKTCIFSHDGQPQILSFAALNSLVLYANCRHHVSAGVSSGQEICGSRIHAYGYTRMLDMPPSTARTWPVIQLDVGNNRNSANDAASLTVPNRLRGWRSAIADRF